MRSRICLYLAISAGESYLTGEPALAFRLAVQLPRARLALFERPLDDHAAPLCPVLQLELDKGFRLTGHDERGDIWSSSKDLS